MSAEDSSIVIQTTVFVAITASAARDRPTIVQVEHPNLRHRGMHAKPRRWIRTKDAQDSQSVYAASRIVPWNDSAMPEVVFKTLIANATPLPPGARVQSSTIDVSGAREVNLMFGIINSDAAVRWAVHFGPAPNGGYALCRQGTFSSVNTQAISIPCSGPGCSSRSRTRAENTQDVDGKVYFIRELP